MYIKHLTPLSVRKAISSITLPSEFEITKIEDQVSVVWKSATGILASPVGQTGVPSFRSLLPTDIPDISATYALATHTHNDLYEPIIIKKNCI